MFEKKSKLKQELGAADAVLGKFDKLKGAIEAEVSGSLAKAIEAHEQARKDLEAAEVQAVLEPGQSGEAAKVGKRLEMARANIDKSTATLRGLRGAVAGLAVELAEKHSALAAGLPAHYREAIEAFRLRWDGAVKEFSRMLGERAALEKLTGEKLTLTEATPTAAVDLGPVADPARRQAALKESLGSIAGWGAFASEAMFNGAPMPTLEAYRVYRLRRPAGDLPMGALVLEASLDPGLLRHMASMGDAMPATDEELQQAAWTATQERRAIDQAATDQAQDRRFKDSQEKAKRLTFEEYPMFPGLSDEERFLRVHGTPEDHMQPEDRERERQRSERERQHSAAHERARQQALAWPAGVPEAEEAPAVKQ